MWVPHCMYTVRSISFRTHFFFLNNRTRAIYWPTHKLSTINQHPFTHRDSFVYLRQCTSYNLSCKVSFLYTSWMAEMNRVVIIFFFFSKPVLLQDIAPTNKTASFCQFFYPPKMLQHFITPRTLQIYLRQIIFCSPS